MKDKRKVYEQKLDAQLKEWDAQIDLLKAKADKARAEAKSEYYKTIEDVQHKQNDAAVKLRELKTAETMRGRYQERRGKSMGRGEGCLPRSELEIQMSRAWTAGKRSRVATLISGGAVLRSVQYRPGTG